MWLSDVGESVIIDDAEVYRELKRWLPLILYEALAVIEYGGASDCRRLAEQLSIYVPSSRGEEKSFFRFMISALYAKAYVLEEDIEKAIVMAENALRFREQFEKIADHELSSIFVREVTRILSLKSSQPRS